MQLSIPKRRRDFLFIGFLAATVAIYFGPLQNNLALSLSSEENSHFLLVPFIAAWFAIVERSAAGANIRYSLPAGSALLLAATVLHAVGRFLMPALTNNDKVSVSMLSMVLFIAGGCLLIYGPAVVRSRLFSLGFLLFLVPIPSALFAWIISLMQAGSAEVTHWLLPLTGTIFVREGLTFHLTTMSVTIAEECSGIRGTMAILITAVIAGKLLLSTWWSRGILALLVLPISFFKNGMRVAALAYLAANVDTKWVTDSALHHDGGFIFFALGLLAALPFLVLLRALERRLGRPTAHDDAQRT